MISENATPRACGTCTLCCKVMEIAALGKPVGVWCRHCAPGVGCRIHAAKPAECDAFACEYLVNPQFGEEWNPERSHIVLSRIAGVDRLTVNVDPQRPDAWRREPFFSSFKRWAAARRRGLVMVSIARRMFVVLPDRDVDLGVVGPNDRIFVTQVQTLAGPRLEPIKLDRNDPRAAALDKAPRAAN